MDRVIRHSGTAFVGRVFLFLSVILLGVSTRADVRVFVQDSNGLVWIRYECTAGEVIRAFALDISVDRGQIAEVSHYFRGESKPGATGYGFFPASFRDHLSVFSVTNINWDLSDYGPLAVVGDAPDGTLPGLNSAGITLAFGGIWDPSVPAATPRPAGTLCAVRLSEAAQVSVAANSSRGGVLPASLDRTVSPVFVGTWADPVVRSSSIFVQAGTVTIRFQSGELETATSLSGPWTGTGNTNGLFLESLGAVPARFYRVRSP